MAIIMANIFIMIDFVYLIASRIPPGHVERAGGRIVNFQFGKMQFTRFRGATFFSHRHFRKRNVPNYSLLLFAARLFCSQRHFRKRNVPNHSLLLFAARLFFRGATFESATFQIKV
jgi:hypothetical protein